MIPRALAPVLALAVALAACASGGPIMDCPRCPDPEPPPPTDAPDVVKPAPRPIDADPVPTDRRRGLRLMGFSADGKRVGLRVQDELMGSVFQVFDVEEDRVVDGQVFGPQEEDATWTRVARKHKLTRIETASAQMPGHDLTLLGADTETHVVVYVMKGERAIPYFRIPRLEDGDGQPAIVSVREIAWEPSGRYAVVIHSQETAQPRRFQSDFMHIVRVDLRRLPFD